MATKFLLLQVERYLDECDRESRAASIRDLAAYVRLTSRELAWHSLSLTGLPPSDLLRERQIARACNLLRTTELPIEVVALHCAFRWERTFYRVFQAVRGMTPGEFREACRSEPLEAGAPKRSSKQAPSERPRITHK
jgi:AraC-like DNA-binding protein